MGRKGPTDQDRIEAVGRVLSGLRKGDDMVALAEAVEPLHPRHNTFPGEIFMRLAGDALELASIGPSNPIAYDGLREKYLPECEFRGRDNRKIEFAILASAAVRGGIEPDLLDEVVWWRTDDFWWYALAAAVALIRASADRLNQSVTTFAEQLAARRDITP
jgi:hypothetical protein